MKRRLGPISAAIARRDELVAPRPLLVAEGAPILSDIERYGEAFLGRFWSKVDRSSDCHIWTAGVGPGGYGRISLGGRCRAAHRVSWVIANRRDIPAQMAICHTCDNRRCVNPDHLWLGSYSENMTDMYAKGRGHSTQARGGLVILANQLPKFISHEERFA